MTGGYLRRVKMTTDPFGGPPFGVGPIGSAPPFGLRLEFFLFRFSLSLIEEGVLLPNSIDQDGLIAETMLL